MDPRLLRFRVELYAAAQTMSEESAREFWALIGELSIAFEEEFRAGVELARARS